MLPAQFTDVATQLAGGQSPWLILLQQGGQVKDSFGGMIPMFRGLAGAITLPMVGATSLAVATGALAYAWYQGNSTLSDFNKTLVLSGNQAGLTADRMLVLSRAGQAAGLTFNQTSESLSALVKAGVSGEAQIASISQSVARFSSASGVEVDNGKQNTYFSSLDNMVAQGNVLPVLYGEMRVGSRVVSQEISTADEGDGGQVVVIGR
ncbi:phage tail length tape measure family protein [Escherichia coli]|uniref:phage tail length tape measure family protein n=1 Tax=Escherichia coli TaxID=562 RepID=UPI003D9AA9A8